jgi:hypothetical protein
VSEHFDENSVLHVLSRFTNAFDLKDWGDLEDCLSENVYADYSDLRGTPPKTLTSKEFVELRRNSLSTVKTHHVGANAQVSFKRGEASARLSMVIFRTNMGKIFNTHCIYDFGLIKTGEKWKIKSIIQRILWNEGDSSIHQGVAK